MFFVTSGKVTKERGGVVAGIKEMSGRIEAEGSKIELTPFPCGRG
jgi:hypothetical protein